MRKPNARQLAALDALKALDPHLLIEWDEETGTPGLVHGSLSHPGPQAASQSLSEAAHRAAAAFLKQNTALYRVQDVEQEFPRRRVVSDKLGSTVHFLQEYHGVEVLDGALTVTLDPQNRVVQVAGRYRPDLSLSVEPAVSAERAVEIAQANLDIPDKSSLPVSSRLLIVDTASFPDVAAKLGKQDLLTWRIEVLVWVFFVDAHDGSIVHTYDNTQTARNRETYNTDNCYVLPGTLCISESGPLPGQPVDDIARSAHEHAGAVYDYYLNNFGLDSFDGKGHKLISSVHGGVPFVFGCTQNNAAFMPSKLQIVFGDGDGMQFGPFARALDVVGHEWTHAVIYFAITWADGSPRGLDYEDQPGALNESYADFFGNLIENKDWMLGEDCYTPQTPNDALRDMADPARYGQPDHYSKYMSGGTQGWMVHTNSGIMNKCAYLMSEGGTHHNVVVRGMGKDNAARIWYRALKFHLQGAAKFRDARTAMLQACQELFPADAANYATVQNAFAAVGLGEAVTPARITVEPTSLDFGSVAVGQAVQRTLSMRNGSTATLSVSAIRSNLAAFSVLGDTAFPLAPGASKTITVQFSPTTGGQQRANMVITCDDATSPTLSVALSGTAVAAPHIVTEPLSLDFGSVSLGQSVQRTLTVRNSGSAELAVSRLTSSEPAFSIAGDTTFRLAAGAARGITIVFKLSAVGPKRGNLTINSNDSAQPTVTVAMSATGVPVSHIVVEPTSLDFGSTPLGQSAPRTLTVRNTGGSELSISGLASSEPAFSIIGETAFQLAAGAARGITIEFKPSAVGSKRGTLTINSSDTSQPSINVPLTGVATAVARIAVEPSSLDFGSVSVGQSAQRTLTVRNASSAAVSISAINSNLPVFSVLGETAFPLAAGTSKTVSVQFLPTTGGQQQARLTIVSDDTAAPTLSVPLVGTGLGTPRIAAEPLSFDFGSISLGQSAQHTLTVRNSGTAELSVSKLTSSEPAFSTSGDRAFQLAPGAASGITITFRPSAVGQTQGSLSISSNDSDQPMVSVALSGSGVAAVSHIVVDPTSLDFGSAALAESNQLTLTLSNTTGATVTISSIRSTGPAFTVVDGTSFQLPPGASRTLAVQFSPKSPGERHATLTISSNDITQPSISVPMSAVAVAMPRISVEPSNLDFGAVTIGRPVQLTLTLRNIGKLDLAISTIRSTEPAFTVVGDTAFALPAGASRTLTIQCSPKNPGQRRATLSINSNDVNQPTLNVPMSALAGAVSRIVVEPSSLDFGSVSVGQSAQRTLTVRNTGTAALSVSAIRSNRVAFLLLGDTAFPLTPGASKAITVQFTPTTAGQQQANLTITSDEPTSPALGVPLVGTGLGTPHIVAEPVSLDFGLVTVGQFAQRTLSVRNAGTADLQVSRLASSESAFSIVGDTAFSVAPGAARDVVIAFKPSAAGPTQATLTIASNDVDQPELTVTLAGSARMPHILVDPSSLDFGSVVLTEAAQLALTLRNTTNVPIVISSIRSTEPAFSIIGDTAFQLAPGASRTLTIQCSPKNPGQRRATLTISSSDSTQPTIPVSMSALAVAVARISVDPTSLDFGSVTLGEPAQRTLTLTNIGRLDLAVSNIRSTEPAFSVVGNTAFSLASHAFRTVTVQFAPKLAGQRRATLTINSNDINQPAISVPMSGTAVAPPRVAERPTGADLSVGQTASGVPWSGTPAGAPSIDVTPTSLDLGRVMLSQAAERTVTLGNHGTGLLIVGHMQTDSPFFSTSEQTAFALEPGASHTFTIRFRPGALGTHSGTFSFVTNDPGRPVISVQLRGAGRGGLFTTAAYGSAMQKDVRTLRRFRDRSLVRSRVGRAVIALYYRCSPAATQWIAGREWRRTFARWLLRPAVAVVRFVSSTPARREGP